MLDDLNNENYADITFFEDTLLWIGREYQKRHIKYGLYGTDSIDEQLALTNFLKVSDDEFRKKFDGIYDAKFEIHKYPSYPVFKKNFGDRGKCYSNLQIL